MERSAQIDILHVEDEPGFADMAKTFLKREDDRFEIVSASNPKDGLDLLSDNEFDCIISDYDMPERNGIEFLEAVRDEHPDQPFILYTGMGSEEIASEAISAGVTDYLQKGSGTDQYIVLANRIRNVTARQQAEQEAERTRTHLKGITSNVNDAILTIDSESTIRFANQAVQDLFGYTHDSLVGESMTQLMPPRYRDAHLDAIERYVETGERTMNWKAIQIPVQHEDGHEIQVSVSFSEFNQDGEQWFVGVLRDISEQIEREQKYERVLDLLNHTQELAGVGGWEINPNTEAVFWSDHLFEMLGWDGKEEPPLEEALDLYVEEDQPRIENAVEEALSAGESFDVEARFRRPDGDIRWFDIRGETTIEDGEVETLRGAVHDITDRKRREHVLRKIHNIISNRNRSFEEQVQALLELGRAELGTKYGTLSKIRGDEYVFEFVDADDDTIKPGDIAPVSATNCEIVASIEQTLVIGDVERDAPEETDRAGFTKWGISSYIGAPVFVGDDVYGTFCFYSTEPLPDQFSDWEEALVDLMSNWASHEFQRQQANKSLQEQNEQLDEFASIVSHDLRNPLNVADGRLELAREDCDSEHLDDVAKAHNRMAALIEDLLTLAREGERVGELELVDLASLTENCWQNVATDDATLTINIGRQIRTDQTRLQQLIENLIRNAVEHGGDDVTITVGELANGFYIEDDGPGIPDAERNDVFEAGYSTSESGTGFGLAIVREIAGAHDWDITVTEGSDDGARFEIIGVEFDAV